MTPRQRYLCEYRRTHLAQIKAYSRVYDRFRYDVASIVKAVLILVLGGECDNVDCGERSLIALEVHHPNGRGWSAKHENSFYRVFRYCDEFKSGVKLGVLCRSHNAVDGWARQHGDPEVPEDSGDSIPF